MRHIPMIRWGLVLAAAAVLPIFAGENAPPKQEKPPVPAEYMELIGPMPAGVHEGATQLPWRLYVPDGAAGGEPLPLVVGLHGAGSRGDDNFKPMFLFKSFWTGEQQKQTPAYVLTPQMNMHRSWVKHKWPLRNGAFGQQEPMPEMETLLALVEETVKQHNIDPARVYVIGMSMGGYGTWDALWRRPDLWAAGVPICGGGDPATMAKLKDMPIWIWHGSKDTVVPPENSRELIEVLKQAGGAPKYNEPAVGHSSWNNAFESAELYEWMFSQKRAAQ